MINKGYVLKILIGVILLSMLLNSSNFVRSTETGVEIIINGDDDWIPYNFPGNGSASNPYIISNLTISSLHISSTGKYFIIKNCSFNSNENFEISQVTSKFSFISNNFVGVLGWLSISECNGFILLNNTFVRAEMEYFYNKPAIEITSSQNCTIRNNTFSNYSPSIFITYTTFITIANNSFSHAGVGLSITNSGTIDIINNTFSSTLINSAIQFYLVDDVVIEKNLVSPTCKDGLTIINSKQISFIDNMFLNFTRLYSYFCNAFTYIGNYFINISEGVIICSTENVFINNSFTKSRFLITKELHVVEPTNFFISFENNTIDGRPINFYKNQEGLTFKSSITLTILQNCSRVSIENVSAELAPFGLISISSESINITSSSFHQLDIAIQLVDCNDVSIRDNIFYDCNISLLDFLSETVIESNTFHNVTSALILRATDYIINLGYQVGSCILTNNIITNVTQALTIINKKLVVISNNVFSHIETAGYINYSVCKVYNNRFMHTQKGLLFGHVSQYGDYLLYNNTFTNSNNSITLADCDRLIIHNNYFEGEVDILDSLFVNITSNAFINENVSLFIQYGLNNTVSYCNFTNNSYGIFAFNTKGLLISNNSFKYNSIGIWFSFVTKSTIKWNFFYNSSSYAIYFSELSTRNEVHFNTFIDNNFSGNSQACDNGNDNSWNNNFWSDWSGKGSYKIDGSAKSKDRSPLREAPNGLMTISAPYSFLGIIISIVSLSLILSNTRISKNKSEN